MGKRVLVTGATGYIAGFVIAELVKHGYFVKGSVRTLTKVPTLQEDLSRILSPVEISSIEFFQADLTNENGWKEAMQGVDAIIHVASPLGTGTESVAQLRTIAEGGTRIILQAALDAGVNRIIMTSSQAASTPAISAGAIVLTEDFWTDAENKEIDAYRLSKLHAEKAAWQFATEHNMALSTILPGAVFGPILSKERMSSNQILLRLINGNIPRAFNISFETSHVKDLAILHRLALEQDSAINQRFLAASQSITMSEVSALFKQRYPYCKAPQKTFPNWVVRILAFFIPALRAMVPMFGRRYSHSTAKAENLLGWTQHTPAETVLAAAESFAQLELLQEKKK